ncbi:hypothetical protein BAUCODRAFT_65552 [Baudoinia panamericana UAMH 10762]|uniref:Mitochondrial distribution and morphology protein 12 n=1 Tax=Baudoinia panamericana (strain UAMH 10762) TaxID=717646 RepID=M2N3T8_BAUPA|nr:uncharacterized protein BAUCODRAFT_65552 [Baudoinia panamericana UAMH 10762]EMC98648.1 hypothetical protein BAUCODRAFT_65552 [Baudoinia panamericana UAMH 10762]
MSVNIDWQTLTDGPDGLKFAECIRDFVHERFQHIPLPSLIRSVKCHHFEFGSIAPQVTLKDICDPLPDFYEDEDDEGASSTEQHRTPAEKVTEHLSERSRGAAKPATVSSHDRATSPTFSRGTTPGILGGTSNLGYFHLPLAAGLSGTNTPLAAVAGARFQQGIDSASNKHQKHERHHAESFSSISPPPSSNPASRPTSRDHSGYRDRRQSAAIVDYSDGQEQPESTRSHTVDTEDLQVVFHVTYDGNIKLSLTAEVFLDYPMPSFVGIPLTLNITGLTFDGVGILAYIKKRAHLCFLAPEDAEALVGGEASVESPSEETEPAKRVGALLEDIRIESEMGQADSGKQVLKNVGKIERFVLEQVQRIFEDEFVYPSFWTFLV